MRIRDVSNDSLFIQLFDEGQMVDSSVVESNTTYYWRVTAGNVCGAGASATWSFTTQAATMVCNGATIDFEDGIPADWTVVNNSPGGIVWTTTADPACEQPNWTNGTGEAACADSDAAGYGAPPYDTELVSNPLDFSAVGAAVSTSGSGAGSGTLPAERLRSSSNCRAWWEMFTVSNCPCTVRYPLSRFKSPMRSCVW